MDILTSEQRTKTMRAVKSSNTRSEQILRKALWSEGIRYRKNYKKAIGAPDIAITKYKIAIFCDGDFWHGKNGLEDAIESNKKYWIEKIKRNKERDLEVTIALRDQGWIVLRFWGKDILKNLDICLEKIRNAIKECKKHQNYS